MYFYHLLICLVAKPRVKSSRPLVVADFVYFYHLSLIRVLLFLKVSNVFNVVGVWFWMNKRGLVGVVVVVGILLVGGFFWFVGEMDSGEEREGCVKVSCCHAKECVWESEAPNCSGRICTMSCEPETMDCGVGHCEVVDGECGVVWDE